MSFSNQTKRLPSNRVGQNMWIVSGKVIKKETKYSGAGNCFVNLTIEIPSNNEKYKSERHRLVAFKEIAEEIETRVQEGTNWCFKANVKNNVYEKEGKKVFDKSFIVNKFEEAVEVDAEGAPMSTSTAIALQHELVKAGSPSPASKQVDLNDEISF